MKTLTFACIFIFVMVCASLQAQTFKHATNYGSNQQFKEFVNDEMVYPDKALQSKTEGKVTLSFLIDKQGKMSDVKVKQAVSPEIDAEALRLLGLLLWNPAEYLGIALDDKKEIEFEFSIKKYYRMVERRGYDKYKLPFKPADTSATLYEVKQLDAQPKPIYEAKEMNFNSFILKNITYPKDAVKGNISGTVTIFFVVETSGRISNLKIINSVGAGCDQEATRLLRLLKWMPGIKKGMAVRTKMTINITFNLQDYENQKYVPANNANQI